jgi:hypothetical protein
MSMSTRLVRLALASALAVAIGWVPVARVAACSCAPAELPDAVGGADVAFVGRIEGAAPAAAAEPALGERVSYRFHVERSRDELPSAEIQVVAWADNGANCGISFAVDERWLILAYGVEGVLETNGCNMNVRLDGSDPELEASISEILTVVPEEAAPESEAGLDVPAPLLLATGVVAVLGLAGFVAFRRKEIA